MPARRRKGERTANEDLPPGRESETLNAGAFATDQEVHHLPFHEYFHGDTGRGVGASHQAGWTALVADLIFRAADHGATGTSHD